MKEASALRDLLIAGGVGEAQASRLADYGGLLLEANRRFNLSGADTPAELAPHILDSLTLAPYVSGTLADVGSGGGLPAIPLAIATAIPVTMIESTAKKAAFLRHVLSELELSGRVVPQRAEQSGRDPAMREAFDCATARAVSSAPAVLELAAPFLRIGGRALLQRGAMDGRERNAVVDAAPMLGLEFNQEVPLGGDRRILVLTKVHSTPERFPRRNGIPEKRPLCL